LTNTNELAVLLRVQLVLRQTCWAGYRVTSIRKLNRKWDR
jgi:hypothetical protein